MQHIYPVHHCTPQYHPLLSHTHLYIYSQLRMREVLLSYSKMKHSTFMTKPSQSSISHGYSIHILQLCYVHLFIYLIEDWLWGAPNTTSHRTSFSTVVLPMQPINCLFFNQVTRYASRMRWSWCNDVMHRGPVVRCVLCIALVCIHRLLAAHPYGGFMQAWYWTDGLRCTHPCPGD